MGGVGKCGWGGYVWVGWVCVCRVGWTRTHRVDEERCNASDSFHQSAVVKQSMLGQRCQGFNGLTHHSLLWVTQTLSVGMKGGGGGGGTLWKIWQGSAYNVH